jgi:hypothetical protein
VVALHDAVADLERRAVGVEPAADVRRVVLDQAAPQRDVHVVLDVQPATVTRRAARIAIGDVVGDRAVLDGHDRLGDVPVSENQDAATRFAVVPLEAAAHERRRRVVHVHAAARSRFIEDRPRAVVDERAPVERRRAGDVHHDAATVDPRRVVLEHALLEESAGLEDAHAATVVRGMVSAKHAPAEDRLRIRHEEAAAVAVVAGAAGHREALEHHAAAGADHVDDLAGPAAVEHHGCGIVGIAAQRDRVLRAHLDPLVIRPRAQLDHRSGRRAVESGLDRRKGARNRDGVRPCCRDEHQDEAHGGCEGTAVRSHAVACNGDAMAPGQRTPMAACMPHERGAASVTVSSLARHHPVSAGAVPRRRRALRQRAEKRCTVVSVITSTLTRTAINDTHVGHAGDPSRCIATAKPVAARNATNGSAAKR